MKYKELEVLSKKPSESLHLESLCKEKLSGIDMKNSSDANSILDVLEYCFSHQMYSHIITWYELQGLDTRAAYRNVHAYYVWSLLFNGEEPSRITSALDLYENKIGDIAALYPVKAFMFKNLGRIQEAIDLLKRALMLMPSSLEYFMSTSHWILGSCYYMTGDMIESRHYYQSAKQHAVLYHHDTIALSSICCMAEMDIQNAHITSAEKLLKEAVTLSSNADSTFTGAIYLGLCEIEYYQNHQHHAKEFAGLAIKSSANTFTGTKLMAHVMLAKILSALGEKDTAISEMRKAASELQYIKKQSLVTLYFEMEQAHLHLIHNDTQLVDSWIEKRGLSLQSVLYDLKNSSRKVITRGINTYYVYARYLYQTDMVQDGLELATEMERSLRDSDRQLLYIKVLALFALTKYKAVGAISNDITATVCKLIELCTAYKTTMVMFEYGADMQSLLRAYIKKNLTDNTASTILDEMATLPIIAQHASSNNFSLSERELYILALLDSQLSVSDIAEREFITENTVKTHIKNIYSKMDVHSRKHAVEIGKQNHLI